MRRTILLLAGVLLSVVAVGSGSPKEYDDKTTVDPLEGTWRLTDCKGVNLNVVHLGEEVLTFHSGIFTLNSNGKTFRGHYRIDSTRNPPHLDYIASSAFSKDQVKLVYQIDGEILRTAFVAAYDDKRRPQGFNTDGIIVHTYKRKK